MLLPAVVDFDLRSSAARKQRRLSLLLVGTLVLVGSTAELLYRDVNLPALAVRVVWGAGLIGVALALSRASDRWYGILQPLAAGGAVVFFPVTVWLTGGFDSPDFQYVATLPLGLMVVFQDELKASIASVATTLLAVAALGAAGGAPMQIAIEDNGPGISSSVAARLFEPFVTSKAIGKGTGLGLAISREHVENFGGKLQLQAHPGSGARFAIRLPAVTD